MPDHPAIANLQEDLIAIEAELTETARYVRQSVRADYLAAQASEAAHQSLLHRLENETLRKEERAVRYRTLAGEADVARSLYDGLLQRSRQLNAAAGIANSNIAIIDRADPPARPSSPSLPRNLGLGFLVGLMAAIAAVYLRDRLDDRIHQPEDIEIKLDLPLLGVLPRTDGAPFNGIIMPHSPLAEAAHMLRGSLANATQGKLPRVLAVTSAQAGEGKTTTCHAIASGFARMGMRVLLIDGELRRPPADLAARFADERGFCDLLESGDMLASAVVQCEDGGFDRLPPGHLQQSPAELLTSPRMEQLLEEASEEYDMVVLDCPPVLGLANATSLAPLADGSILVIAASESRAGQVIAALRRLRSFNAVLLGAVLTGFDPVESKGSQRPH